MYNGKLSMMDMFKDTDREPGNFGKAWGADQLKGKSAAEVEIIKTKELKNGRLAMMAIGGIIHHTIIEGTETFGPISAWADKLYMPMHIGLPGL
jgi:light-harvesting complex I chlorophyll a/b binding protein 4